MDNKPAVIVTGASRGIGAAIARLLGKSGLSVTLVARSATKLRKVADQVEDLGGKALVVAMDIADSAACTSVVEKTISQFGRLDAVINNAGVVTPIATVSQADRELWKHNLEVNLLGPFYLTQAALPHLRQRKGKAIFVSSGAAVHSIESASAYCSAKAALNHFTVVLAAEEPKITVIAVRPGVVDTKMQQLIRKEGPENMKPEQVAYYQGLKDTGKLEAPQVPARSIAWLALYAPSLLSGQFVSYNDPDILKPAVQQFGPV